MAGSDRPNHLRRAASVVALLAAGVLLLRLLGPGGRPAVERSAGPPPPPPAAAAATPFSGSVLRADGTPAAGADVEAVFGTGDATAPVSLRSGPLGPDGRFALAGAPAKWTTLKVRARAGPLSVDVDLGDAAGLRNVDLRLPATFALRGIVIAAEDGRPLPRMEVRVGDRGTATDALGRFALDGVPAPAQGRAAPEIVVTGEGRKPLRRPIPMEGGADDLLLRVEGS